MRITLKSYFKSIMPNGVVAYRRNISPALTGWEKAVMETGWGVGWVPWGRSQAVFWEEGG